MTWPDFCLHLQQHSVLVPYRRLSTCTREWTRAPIIPFVYLVMCIPILNHTLYNAINIAWHLKKCWHSAWTKGQSTTTVKYTPALSDQRTIYNGWTRMLAQNSCNARLHCALAAVTAAVLKEQLTLQLALCSYTCTFAYSITDAAWIQHYWRSLSNGLTISGQWYVGSKTLFLAALIQIHNLPCTWDSSHLPLSHDMR